MSLSCLMAIKLDLQLRPSEFLTFGHYLWTNHYLWTEQFNIEKSSSPNFLRN